MPVESMLVAKVRAVHGVRGEVKLASFTQPPEALFSLPLYDANTQPVHLVRTGVQKGLFLCRIDGINDRNAAEAIKGLEFFAAREALPALAPQQSYVDDLIGLQVISEAGAAIGTVREVVNYGASDILVMDTPTGELMLPYATQFFPHDAKEGTLVCVMPEYVNPLPQGEKQSGASQ